VNGSPDLLVEWLKPLRVYQLSFVGQYGRNPDQRIQEDTRLLDDYSADLGCGIVYSLLQIVASVGVLRALSAQVTTLLICQTLVRCAPGPSGSP
jgi:putative ATP-binding cassette transporter